MVLDVFENRERYYSLHKSFKKAFEFLEKCMQQQLEPGKYSIAGDDIYAVVQQYETANTGNWEAHRKYIDIQFVLEGQEIIKWANIAKAAKDAKYDEGSDFLDCGEIKDAIACKLEKSYFSILYPEDLHKPKCIWNEKSQISKIVVKVAL